MDHNDRATPALVAQPIASANVVTELKLPPFSPIDAHHWFQRAEIKFRRRNISRDETKVDHILEAVPEDVFPRISEWLTQKGDAVTYSDLRNHLLRMYTPSAANRAATILRLSTQDLGDQRPSEALLDLQALVRLPPDEDGNTRTLDLLRELWLRRLPEPVREALTNAQDMTYEELREKADALLDASTAASQRQQVCVIDEDPLLQEDPPTENTQVAAAQATKWFQKTATTYNKRLPPPGRHLRPYPPSVFPSPVPPTPVYHHPVSAPTRRLPQQQQPRQLPPGNKVCYYHSTFGPEAKKCQPGCTWPKNVFKGHQQ